MRRSLVLACSFALCALVAAAPASAAGLPRVVNGKHVVWGAGQGYPSTDQASANNLIYHGSNSYTSTTVQNYINSFFGNVGGSAWAGVQTQYCQGITAPAFSCTGQAGAQFITNPTGQLKGTWTDPSPVPADILATGLASN